jgi:hypothetical protein
MEYTVCTVTDGSEFNLRYGYWKVNFLLESNHEKQVNSADKELLGRRHTLIWITYSFRFLFRPRAHFLTFLSNCGRDDYSDPLCGCIRAVDSNSSLTTDCRVRTVLFNKILWQGSGRDRLLEFSPPLTTCYWNFRKERYFTQRTKEVRPCRQAVSTEQDGGKRQLRSLKNLEKKDEKGK